MKHKLYGFRKWILAAAFVAAAGICHSCGRETVSLQSYTADEGATERALESRIDGDAKDSDESQAKDSQAEPGNSPKESGAVCYVHICGAVASPGVYEMDAGQRIYQVVERAGGYTEEAAADYLNLAAEVSDGMKLVVPTREELLSGSGENLYGAFAPEKTEEASTGKVNLNTAAKEQLMGLSGIGEAKADEIIRYRQEHGGFKKVEDIMKVPGIKDAAYQKIKDEVTV